MQGKYKYMIWFSLVILALLTLLVGPVFLLRRNSSPSQREASKDQANAERQLPSSDTEASADSRQAAALTAVMQDRYGADVTLLSSQGSLCTFQKTVKEPVEGLVLFQADYATDSPSDNYHQELLHFLGDSFSCGSMTLQWKETGSGIWRRYTPVFVCYGRGALLLEAYCDDICDFLEFCMKNEEIAAHPELLSSFLLAAGTQEISYPDISLEAYDRISLYNELYVFADTFTLSALATKSTAASDQHTDSQASPGQHTDSQASSGQHKDNQDSSQDSFYALSPDTASYYLSLEPDCVFRNEQGMEYRMVGADRAAGSSYYVLLGTKDNGRTCSFWNPDPYNGSGGTAKWLTFLDENLGFSCLAYSGGSYGILYRTEDGGRSFTCIEYPSSMIPLPNGALYNPFVMPDRVYEEEGLLYLVAGQGPDGDYHGEYGRCSGLYRSEDQGKTWTYVGQVPSN